MRGAWLYMGSVAYAFRVCLFVFSSFLVHQRLSKDIRERFWTNTFLVKYILKIRV